VSDSTTDLYAAAELLIQPPEQEAGDDNPSEVENSAPEPTQETESDDVEAQSQDDVEASDDDEIDADEFDEVEADTETPDTFTVKVNGKTENWTLDQLKQSASGQSYINQRMQEVSRLEKQFKEQQQHLAQQQEQFVQIYNNAAQGGMQPPVPPVYDPNDPIGWIEAKAQFEQDQAAYQHNAMQVQQIQQQRQAEQSHAQNQYLQEQAALLAEYIPDITDPEKGEVFKRRLHDVGTEHYGFSTEEIQGVRDARMVRVLNDATKWRQLQSKRKAAQAKGSQVAPISSGAKKRKSSSNAATRNKAQSRLQKSGRIEDAIDLLIQP
tara:strand:+ start:6265 stop:7233 length:969 start_codon:yes stop_codon:yes gene_type:complete